jgi:hypothetical protein
LPIPEFTRAEYDEARNIYEFKALVAIAGISVIVGGVKTSARFIRTTQLFTRMTIGGFSFLRLLPGNSLKDQFSEFWDWPSVACIARNLVETYHLFWYLADPSLSEEDVHMRLELMRYHLNFEKYRLYKEGGQGQETLSEFEEGLPQERAALASLPAFRSLPKALQSDLLKGKRPMHLTHTQIGNSLPFITGYFQPIYRLFSNQVHSTPFSFSAQSNERGRGFENDAERLYVTLSVQVVTKYMTAAVIEMARIFPDAIAKPCAGLIDLARQAHSEV